MTAADDFLNPVKAALDVLDEPVSFWLRDDDAIAQTPALSRLARLTDQHRIPLLLASIPQPADETLARLVDNHRLITPAVHGWRHDNHAGIGEKAQELGAHRPAKKVLAELAQGRDKLRELFGSAVSGLLVPPWNRIAPALVNSLPQLGFTGLSTFGETIEADGVPGLCQLNTHLDIIDWKGSRGGRDPHWLARELARLINEKAASNAAIGTLTHHLVHDETAWIFLEALFAVTSAHPKVRWVSADDWISAHAA